MSGFDSNTSTMQKLLPLVVVASTLFSLQEVGCFTTTIPLPSCTKTTNPNNIRPSIAKLYYTKSSLSNLSNVRRITSLSPINTLLYVSSTPSAIATSATFNEGGNDQLKINQDEKNNDATVVVVPSPGLGGLSKKEMIRQQGGLFSISTKYGGLNLFSCWYGFVAIAFGIPWYILLTTYQLIQNLTGNRFDRNRRIPTVLNHVWGILLMRLTFCYPSIINRHILTKFYNEKRCAMFVANHNSWMDIPFLGATIGWQNYKLISKKELGKVPILGKAIKVAGNLMVDRSDRKSGLVTLKKGIQYLKDGIHLCTFPEGTRTRNGRLMEFKNGAFKMAHKAGAPVIPISIVNAEAVMPVYWMFPYRPAHNICHVVVHEPIESVGISEEALAEKVRDAMISGLPTNQRPIK